MIPEPEFYGSTTISDKGQVVIPIEARNSLGLEKGEKLLVLGGPDKRGIMLVKLSGFKELSVHLRRQSEEIEKILEGGR
jgi:AbrB family looped-hinge helix DNA binding protein